MYVNLTFKCLLFYFVAVTEGSIQHQKPHQLIALMKAKVYLEKLILFLLVFTFGSFTWYFIHPPYCNNTGSPRDVPVHETRLKLYNFTYPIHLLDANDYNRLVNYEFQFAILNMGCNENTILLVLVHSTVSNFEKRRVIRDTWGNKLENVQLYFVLGKSMNNSIQEKLLQENQLFHDIIQGNFLDTYRNLTYKHVMCLKYAIYHCPWTKYVLKTDDDVFINMPLLKTFLLHHGSRDLLYCHVKISERVLRSYRSKWRVAFKEYPFRVYPTYCLGWAIIYSADVIFKLYTSAQATTKVFWIDDVYVTGILASKSNVSHTDNTGMRISKAAQDELVNNDVLPDKLFIFGQPDLKESEIEYMWTRLRGL